MRQKKRALSYLMATVMALSIVLAMPQLVLVAQESIRYLPTPLPLIDNYSGQRIGALSPQLVRVVAQDGDWLQIDTWLGYHWINWARTDSHTYRWHSRRITKK